MFHRVIITEKGNNYIQNTEELLRQYRTTSHKKNNSNLPPLKDLPHYTILETFNTAASDFPNIIPFKNKRAQSLFFYENNKKLMNFHNKKHNDLKQKSTIFSSIANPFAEKKDFHETSLDLLKKMKNKLNTTINSQFLQSNLENDLEKLRSGSNNDINFTFFSPKVDTLANTSNVITQIQKTFYTKPLVKHLNEIEIIEKIQSKKIDYYNDKYKYFENLKDIIKIQKDKRSINKQSKIMDEFIEEEKIIDDLMELFQKEKERFYKRLRKYSKKFDCKNSNKLYVKPLVINGINN